jgi:hypothetical protein
MKDEALKLALEVMHDQGDVGVDEWIAAEAAIKKALAAPVQQTCNCRWDGEVQVQQCTLHEAHLLAVHEWAGRAKAAEAKLAAQPAPVPDYAWPTVADYEKDAGFEVNEAFKMAWVMARTTNDFFTQMGKNT